MFVFQLPCWKILLTPEKYLDDTPLFLTDDMIDDDCPVWGIQKKQSRTTMYNKMVCMLVIFRTRTRISKSIALLQTIHINDYNIKEQ